MNLSRLNKIKYALLAISLLSSGCASRTTRQPFLAAKSRLPAVPEKEFAATAVQGGMQSEAPIPSGQQASTGNEEIREELDRSSAMPQVNYAVDSQPSDSSPFSLASAQRTYPVTATPVTYVENVNTESGIADNSTSSLLVSNASRNANYAEWMSQYIIECGDELEIKFRDIDDLNEVVTVRPDGMISLQLVGDIPANGLTPEQLRQILVTAFAAELKKPEIAVIVRTFSGNNIYVCGEVGIPGKIPLSGRVTTLKAIILAGGFKDTADRERVIVRRDDGSCRTYDLGSFMECCSNGSDIQLRPYDVVYVPKSRIAKINLWVEQYIDKVLPFSRSFGVFIQNTGGINSAISGP